MEREFEPDHYYLSALAYAKKTGINPETVKAMLRTNQLEGFVTEGQYKIKVYKNGSVSREEYESILKEKIKLETQLNNIKAVFN